MSSLSNKGIKKIQEQVKKSSKAKKEDGYEPEINLKQCCGKPLNTEMEEVRDKLKKEMLDLRSRSMRGS